jgi:membrane-associated phospholipid phosphatase
MADLSFHHRRGLVRHISIFISLLAILSVMPNYALGQSAADCDDQTDQADQSDQNCPTPLSRSLGAIKAYVAAPLRWDTSEWLYFGGALAAIGVAHHYDSQVRSHFTHNSASALSTSSTDTLQDAVPAAALFLGTWGYANLIDDSDGRREVRTMLEATVLSVGTAYVLNYATGRKAPDQTTDPNRWWSGGSSFPSEHTTAAFAIGTVLAESGGDDYRWVRRVLGYGAAGFTAYERLKHDAHWLSDTVAGGALGAASAQFAMNRRRNADAERVSSVELTPLYRGVMLHYVVRIP